MITLVNILWNLGLFLLQLVAVSQFILMLNPSPGCWPDFILKYWTLQSPWSPVYWQCL